jgi:hypothetical protein
MVGPSAEDEVDGVAAGADGSLWLTGKFEGEVDLGGVALSSVGKADIPLARVTPDGELAWATSFGGPGEDNLFDIDVGADGAVATGWFEGQLALGDVTLTSAGGADCVVVAFDDDGGVRWATAFGGPGDDGCNEVVVATDGSVVTSMDTTGGWETPAGPIPGGHLRDTVLLRLDAGGSLDWARLVGGPGGQRGKALAVAPDGTIAFGGDSVGPLELEGRTIEGPGARADGFVSLWSDRGELRWAQLWGGTGRDLVKGLAFDEADDEALYAVGTFEGPSDLGGHPIDAGAHTALVVTRLDRAGDVAWTSAIRADGPVAGAEATQAPGGGVVFGLASVPGLGVVAEDGTVRALDPSGRALLVGFDADGSLRLAWPIEGSEGRRTDEIARSGHRIYLDTVVRDDTPGGSRKDASVVAIDLPPR